MRKRTRHFQWKGRIETLEDRRVMSAESLLGGSIEHHAFVEDEPPQIEHQLVSGPDFWLDPNDLTSLEDQLDRIEQTLYSAHNTTGLNSVVSNYGFTGVGQTVAVIDSGIAYDHFALGGGFGSNYKVVGGWDFSEENDANPYDDGPSGSHGTHVAGIVGGTAGQDKGVAPGVDLVALRVFNDIGDGYFSWVENALKWVIQNRTAFENPITAINLSLGVSSWNSSTIPGWSSLEDEFATLKAAGVFIAVSAGNSFQTFNAPGLSYPAASPNVVPVMSVTDTGALAYYSQRDTRAIAAPGSAIRSTVPDYKGNNNNIADDYANFSGTSMASPYIAGASVLIRQAMEFAGHTNISQDTIYNHMMSTATSFVDSVTGLTFKRLNLGAAIDALMPADDYGSSVAAAHNMGSLTGNHSFDGTIGTVSDVDYFKFTAASNGRVTFAVSDATYNMDPAWSLSNGTGTLSNNGDTFSFDIVAGQTYTVGLSSSSGIGHYSLDVSAQSTFSYTDLGNVSFAQLNSMSVNGQAWYRVTATQTGYLTVEGMYNAQGGQVSLQLYNSNMQPMVTGNSVNGTSRVDAYATAGQQFYVCVTGTNSNVNYRLSNLVSVSGTTVNVAGTSGDDTFSFTAGNTHTVTVNGVTHTFSSLAVNAVNFNGGSGSDRITMTGTSGDETATLYAGSAAITGEGYSINTTSVETAIVHGTGGNDIARLYDTAGNDLLQSYSDRTVMSGNNYWNRVTGFKSVLGFSTQGSDIAYLYDSAGNDVFSGYADRVVMEGGGTYRKATGFAVAQAYSTLGNDVAYMYDTPGDDVYWTYADRVVLYGGGFYNRANGFDITVGVASSGYDTAHLYDSLGDDKLSTFSDRAIIAGAGFANTVRAFELTIGYASQGYDTAYLYDSPYDDVLVAYPDRAVMTTGATTSRAVGFDLAWAFASVGNDIAHMYGSAGGDTYLAYPDRVVMTGPGYLNRATNFMNPIGYASAGNDAAYMYDSSGNDRYEVYSDHVALFNTTFNNRAKSFKSTVGGASNSHEMLAMYDTASDDYLEIRDAAVTLTSIGRAHSTTGFDYAKLCAQAGGFDTTDLHFTDFAFDLIGN